ncbi:hypothetical protein [Amycolatopsis vancoresmycina]|uniref:Uncharacterized protein n=1 Tax=Amycolatopsis vancoresmycina DSM 44592 TaxID=1292037 RepID=R1FXI3_9PSEU|nr:hypothetical protein [Amycolatopsis vancoresmycina]EOD64007.1 hypothetical protein H480_34085 [Amycolatopsis vancoresmycina DSM 44592]
MTAEPWPVRLYPRAFRERWGADLAAELRANPRRWPNVLMSAVGMWLHPAAWPATSPAQRQARIAAMAVMVTGIGWFVTNLAIEDTRTLSGVLNSCAFTVVAGLLFIGPRPAPSAGRRLMLRLTAPAALGSTVVAVVHEVGGPFPAPIRLLLLLTWWGTWALAVIQVGRTVAELAVTPHPRAFRLGIRLLATSAAAIGATQLVAAATGAAPVTACFGLLLLAAPFFLRPPERAI